MSCNYLKNDYLYSTFSRALGVALGIAYMVLFNRYFGVELKGESAVILNYVALGSTLLDCGVTQSYSYFKKEMTDIKRIYFNNVIFVFFLLINLIIILLFIDINNTFKIAAIILPLRVFANQINALIAIEYPRKRNHSVIVLNVIDILILSCLFVGFSVSIDILVCFLVIKELLSLIITLIVAKHKMHFAFSDLIYFPRFIRFGSISMICVLLMEINYRVDVLILGMHTSLFNIGIYSLAVSISERVWLIPDSLKDILLARLATGTDSSEVSKVCRISLWACLCTILFFYFAGEQIIVAIFGKDFSMSYDIMCILLIGVIGMIFYKMMYAYFIINGKQIVNVVILSLSALLNIVGNYFFIPIWDIKGAAITSVFSYTLCGLLYICMFRKETGSTFSDILMLKKKDFKI